MKKLRIGFIGTGGMADVHLKALSDAEEFSDVQIVAFCDVVQERAQRQANKYRETKAMAYPSPEAMIQDAGLDACYILLPPFAHGESERACIARNVPFFVEKPVGKDLGLLRELSDEITGKNLITAVGYMNRYQPPVQRAKEAFSTDEAILAYGGWLGEPPTSDNDYMAESLIGQWWVVKEKSGGQMVEQVTHTVDLVRYFLGDAVEIYAHATTEFNKKLSNLLPGYTIDDVMTTSIKFQSGALATIIASTATPVGGGISLNVLGAKTAVTFSGWGHHAHIIHKSGDVAEEIIDSIEEIFSVESRAFLDAVSTGERSKILSDYADGFKTTQVALGANLSAATGKPVHLTD